MRFLIAIKEAEVRDIFIKDRKVTQFVEVLLSIFKIKIILRLRNYSQNGVKA